MQAGSAISAGLENVRVMRGIDLDRDDEICGVQRERASRACVSACAKASSARASRAQAHGLKLRGKLFGNVVAKPVEQDDAPCRSRTVSASNPSRTATDRAASDQLGLCRN